MVGIGETIVGISHSTSAIEPTYGVAAHSLVLLSSYLFSFGFYLSAISISNDISLRKSIKGSMHDLVGIIGSAQMEQEIEKKVTKIIQIQQKEMEKQVGSFSSEVTETNVKDYVKLAIKVRDNMRYKTDKKRFDKDNSIFWVLYIEINNFSLSKSKYVLKKFLLDFANITFFPKFIMNFC